MYIMDILFSHYYIIYLIFNRSIFSKQPNIGTVFLPTVYLDSCISTLHIISTCDPMGENSMCTIWAQRFLTSPRKMGMRAHGWKNYQSCHTHGNDTYKSNHLGLVVSMREETLVNGRRRRVILSITVTTPFRSSPFVSVLPICEPGAE